MALAEYFVVWQCWNDLPVPSFQQLESLRSSVFLPRPPHFFVPARLPRVIMYCIRLSSASVVAPVLQAGGPPPPSGSAQPTGSHIVHLSERAKTKLVAGLQCLLQRPSMRARQYSMNLDWPAVRDGSVTSDQGALRPREIMVAVETFRSSSPENLVDKVEEWFDGVRGVVNIFQGLSTAGREETAPVDEAPLYYNASACGCSPALGIGLVLVVIGGDGRQSNG